MSDQELKKSSGFSLVEVMVAAGILMILVMVISAVFVNANNEAAAIQLKLDYFNLENQLTVAFRHDSSCKNNLIQNAVDFPTNIFTLTHVKNYDEGNAITGTIVPALNTPYPTGSRLSVTGMRLVNIQTLIANKEYVATVRVDVVHNLSATHQFKPILIEGIRVNLDGAGAIQGCVSQVKLTCVTGFLYAQDLSPTGATISSNSDPNFVTAFSSVFTIINSPPKWGLQCNAPAWIISGCSTSGLLSVLANTDSKYTIGDSAAMNGCIANTSAIPAAPQPNQGLYLTCCTTR